MKLSTFIEAGRAIGIPPGNYIIKSKKTGVVFWFMVGTDIDRTIKERHKPGSSHYGEFEVYRSIDLPWEREWIKKLYEKARQLIKRRK
jgi:hypothetical protein